MKLSGFFVALGLLTVAAVDWRVAVGMFICAAAWWVTGRERKERKKK